MFKFRLLAQDPDTGARAGEFETPHGVVPTPAFMPCATQGTVKALTPVHLEEIGAQMLLANAYHLSLRPGAELIARMGGLHRFMNWEKPILTDSGGFQVFSMSAPRTARKGARIRARPASRRSGGQVAQRAGSPVAAEEMFHEDSREGNGRESSSRQSSLPVIHAPVVSEGGVLFKSHLDGREIFLTPERCMEMENRIGADVIMPLDECAPFPCEKAPARAAMERTLGWAARCKAAHRREDQALFGIVQGADLPGTAPRVRRPDRRAGFPRPCHRRLSVGEGDGLMEEMTARTLERLPPAKPRYLMGVGRPEDILACGRAGGGPLRLRASDALREKRTCIYHPWSGKSAQCGAADGRPAAGSGVRLPGVPKVFARVSLSSLQCRRDARPDVADSAQPPVLHAPHGRDAPRDPGGPFPGVPQRVPVRPGGAERRRMSAES